MRAKPFIGAIVSLLALFGIVAFGPDVRNIPFESEFIKRSELWGDYFDSLLFCIHLYYVGNVLKVLDHVLFRWQNIIRWAASLTFSLYLFHRPIIQFIAAMYEGDVTNWYYRVFMILFTLLFVAVCGRWCEEKKGYLKRFLISKF